MLFAVDADTVKLSTKVLKVGHFFGGPVTGVSALAHSMSAASAEDGTVQLWKHADVDGDVYSQLVASWNLVDAATACHSCYESAIIAVGTEVRLASHPYAARLPLFLHGSQGQAWRRTRGGWHVCRERNRMEMLLPLEQR